MHWNKQNIWIVFSRYSFFRQHFSKCLKQKVSAVVLLVRLLLLKQTSDNFSDVTFAQKTPANFHKTELGIHLSWSLNPTTRIVQRYDTTIHIIILAFSSISILSRYWKMPKLKIWDLGTLLVVGFILQDKCGYQCCCYTLLYDSNIIKQYQVQPAAKGHRVTLLFSQAILIWNTALR